MHYNILIGSPKTHMSSNHTSSGLTRQNTFSRYQHFNNKQCVSCSSPIQCFKTSFLPASTMLTHSIHPFLHQQHPTPPTLNIIASPSKNSRPNINICTLKHCPIASTESHLSSQRLFTSSEARTCWSVRI